VTGTSVKALRAALVEAGLEVFRVRGDEVHLAERQNLHLMDAGVRVQSSEPLTVTVTARAQRSDAPTLQGEQLFAAVRGALEPLFALGFTERSATERALRSVSDEAQVLDVWFEVTLGRDFEDLPSAIDAVRRALATERYVVASSASAR
jgi:hypothetical protein